MPPLPAAPNIVRVAISGTNQTMPFQNVIHMRYAGAAPDVTALNGLCTAMLSAWSTNFGPLCQAGVALTGAIAQDLTNAAAAQGGATSSAAGTRTGTAMPVNIALCATWRINLRYRGGHPRTYLPAGVVADTLSGHLWQDAFITTANASATAFRTALNAITSGSLTWSFVALRRYRAGVLLDPPEPYTVQSGFFDHRIDTQRKRLGKDVPV